MVSETWLTIFDRAMRKPRRTTGLPDGVNLTNQYILQAWVDLVIKQLQLRPQDTHEQRRASAEKRWWELLFPNEAFPTSPRDFRKISYANDAFFRSLQPYTSQWRYIVRKAVRRGHRVASLCESWVAILTQLAQNQDHFSHQNTPVFIYKAELMWFECLFPDEAFPGQPPRGWSTFNFSIETANLERRKEEQRIRGGRNVQSWLGTVASGANLMVETTPGANTPRNTTRPQQSTPSSARSSVTLQAQSHSQTHDPLPGPQIADNAVPETHQPTPENHTQANPLPMGIRLRYLSSPSLPSVPTPQNTLPWEEQRISADDWTVAFLDSTIEEHRKSVCERGRQRLDVDYAGTAANKRYRNESGEDLSRKKMRFESEGS